MITGTLIRISANSWIRVWIGLEINLLSFIPLINSNNIISSERSLKYFLIQALASIILLFATLNLYYLFNLNWSFKFNFIENIILISLFLKRGVAPFHFWFPEIIDGLRWTNAFILITWQKIAPLFLISYYFNFSIIILTILISSYIGAINGLNQTSFKKLLAFSSINHLRWMLSRILFNERLWLLYFLNYFILNLPIVLLFFNLKIFQFNQIFNNFLFSSNLKIILILNFLSLGGLPPFLGFFPKWIVIESLINQNQYILIWIIIIFSLITLFFYIRISVSSFIFNSISQNWIFFLSSNYKNNLFYKIFLLFSTISIFGLTYCSLLQFLF